MLGPSQTAAILERLGLTTKKGKRLLKKRPFIVCQMFGEAHAMDLYWAASDRYYEVFDDPRFPDVDEADLEKMSQAENECKTWCLIKVIRDEALGLMRPRGLDRMTPEGRQVYERLFGPLRPEAQK
jgi:hypothetical protein